MRHLSLATAYHSAALAALLCLPQLAFGDETAEQPSKDALFERLDANGDGHVTDDEVAEEHERLFRRLLRNSDQDQDGKISREEFAAGLDVRRPQRAADEGGLPPRPEPGAPGDGRPRDFDPAAMMEWIKQLDANGDSKVVLDEVPEQRRELFERMMERIDRDGDEAISFEELRAGAARFAQFAQQRPPRPAGRPPQGPPAGSPLMRALDKDRDGELSAEEISAAADALKSLDRNSDGRLSGREVVPPREPKGDGRPPRPGQFGDAGRPDGQRIVVYLMRGDKDGDGKLSEDELPERMRRRFDRMDANSDGVVDEAELKRAAEFLARAAADNPQSTTPPPTWRRQRREETQEERELGFVSRGARRPEALPIAGWTRRAKQAANPRDSSMQPDEAPERDSARRSQIDLWGQGLIANAPARPGQHGSKTGLAHNAQRGLHPHVKTVLGIFRS